jgi:hypothetical protein
VQVIEKFSAFAREKRPFLSQKSVSMYVNSGVRVISRVSM